jgi:AcrR family transcriptional regulator
MTAIMADGIEKPVPGSAAAKPKRSRQRFEKRREMILDAASRFINDRGAKGCTFQAVSEAAGLNTTSVTHYFPRKELLAQAVFTRTISRLADMATEASREATPQARVRRFLDLNIELRAEVLRGENLPLTTLSDVRTLDEAIRTPLELAFQDVFRIIRGFFGPSEGEAKVIHTAHAHILLEAVFWLPIWISRYPLDEFPRVSSHFFDILANGLALPGTRWAPVPLRGDADGEGHADGTEESAPAFIKTATCLINESGYRGASVVRIVDALNVTKGSFYHHLQTKDELIAECFRRSFRRISRVQRAGAASGSNEWDQLASVIAALLDIQFDASWPLTRTSALQSLPPALRAEVVSRSDRVSLRFSGLLIDGAVNGNMRLVDPLIASQCITAVLNAAYDLRKWASRQERAKAIRYYASTLVSGLFTDPAELSDERAARS